MLFSGLHGACAWHVSRLERHVPGWAEYYSVLAARLRSVHLCYGVVATLLSGFVKLAHFPLLTVVKDI